MAKASPLSAAVAVSGELAFIRLIVTSAHEPEFDERLPVGCTSPKASIPSRTLPQGYLWSFGEPQRADALELGPDLTAGTTYYKK